MNYFQCVTVWQHEGTNKTLMVEGHPQQTKLQQKLNLRSVQKRRKVIPVNRLICVTV